MRLWLLSDINTIAVYYDCSAVTIRCGIIEDAAAAQAFACDACFICEDASHPGLARYHRPYQLCARCETISHSVDHFTLKNSIRMVLPSLKKPGPLGLRHRQCRHNHDAVVACPPATRGAQCWSRRVALGAGLARGVLPPAHAGVPPDASGDQSHGSLRPRVRPPPRGNARRRKQGSNADCACISSHATAISIRPA